MSWAKQSGRGVDVRLLLPGKSDIPVIRHAGHGYFLDLLRRGVRIFEYQNAILHAKTLVADDFLSIVGSTNLDFRSFHFNAESNVVVMDQSVAEVMAAAFRDDLAHAVEVKAKDWGAPAPPFRAGAPSQWPPPGASPARRQIGSPSPVPRVLVV